MKLSITIMAHPSRASFIPELMDSIDNPESHVVDVVWDQISSRWDTGKRAWQSGILPGFTHHLVLQDDAILCRDFVAGVERALHHVPPGHPMGLYFGNARPYKRLLDHTLPQIEDEVSFLTMRRINWGVGIVMPTVLIQEVVDFADGTERDGWSNLEQYDYRISKWFEAQKPPRHCYYPWPSLVDHRDSPSLVHGRSGGRHARRFVGEDNSALDVNWGGSHMTIPILRHKRTQR